MSDTTIAVIVALLAGILIAAFFIGMGTSKRKKKMEIERYCKEKGYLCSYNDSGLEHVLEVKREGFILQSRGTSQYHDAQTGSDSWQREIVWQTNEGGKDTAEFILGTVQSSLAWEQMPELIQSQVLHKMGMDVVPGAPQEAPELIKIRNGTLLLFRISGQMRKQKTERIADELSGWPLIQGLTIKADSNALAIRLTNAALKSSLDIERFVRLGRIIKDQ